MDFTVEIVYVLKDKGIFGIRVPSGNNLELPLEDIKPFTVAVGDRYKARLAGGELTIDFKTKVEVN